jgi:hypothetical protein
MKKYGGVKIKLHTVITLWRLMVSFTHQPFYSWVRTFGSYQIGGSLDPRASLDVEAEMKLLAPGGDQILVLQPVGSLI